MWRRGGSTADPPSKTRLQSQLILPSISVVVYVQYVEWSWVVRSTILIKDHHRSICDQFKQTRSLSRGGDVIKSLVLDNMNDSIGHELCSVHPIPYSVNDDQVNNINAFIYIRKAQSIDRVLNRTEVCHYHFALPR